MNRNPIITCAVTGAGDTAGRHPDLPITPEQIATAALEAAEAGAAIVHIHVRDPATGKGSRDVELYRRAVKQVRAANTDVIINTTAGMGGDLLIGDPNPFDFQPEGTDLVSGLERLAHVEALKPDMCSIDCGTLNFGEGHQVYVSTPNMIRDMAKRVRELGVKPELEIFDTGHLWLANTLVDEAWSTIRHGSSFAPASPTACLPTWGCWPRRSTCCLLAPSSPPSHCRRSRSRGSPRRSCSAATSGWAWRTTSTWLGACSPPTPTW